MPKRISLRVVIAMLSACIALSGGIGWLLGHWQGHAEGVEKGTATGLALVQDAALAGRVAAMASQGNGLGKALCDGFTTGLTKSIQCNTLREADQLFVSADATERMRGQYCRIMLTTLQGCGEKAAFGDSQ